MARTQQRRRVRQRRKSPDLTLEDLVARWDESYWTIRGWIYKSKVLRPLPSSRGNGAGGPGRRGLRFSMAEVKRFEALFGVRRRKGGAA